MHGLEIGLRPQLTICFRQWVAISKREGSPRGWDVAHDRRRPATNIQDRSHAAQWNPLKLGINIASQRRIGSQTKTKIFRRFAPASDEPPPPVFYFVAESGLPMFFRRHDC